MSFSIGIVGLPNVGKSTLFNALTKCSAPAANYPFCTIDPNVGIVKVPDERLEQLAKVSQSAEIIPTVVEFVDIAGLVKNAHQGEGLGNQFLSHIREVDAICEVVRVFEDENVIHVDGKIDPASDIETIKLELIFADLATIDKRLGTMEKEAKAKPQDKELNKKTELIKKIKTTLEANQLANVLKLSLEEKNLVKDLNLLTLKPFLYLLNVSEEQFKNEFFSRQAVEYPSISQKFIPRSPSDLPFAKATGHPPFAIQPLRGILAKGDKNYTNPLPNETVIPLCAKMEADLGELDEAEAQEYLNDLGIKKSGLGELIAAAYKLLNLITFFTSGPKETRAWTVENGAKAPQAAGRIHTDFEKGFIRAEVISWQDLVKCGNEVKAKELGLLRIEGKEYVVQDGDVVHFRFNV